MSSQRTLCHRAVGVLVQFIAIHNPAGIEDTELIANRNIGSIECDLGLASSFSSGSSDSNLKLTFCGSLFFGFLKSANIHRTSFNLERQYDLRASLNLNQRGFINTSVNNFDFSVVRHHEDIHREQRRSEGNFNSLIGFDVSQRQRLLTTSDSNDVIGTTDRCGVHFVKMEVYTITTSKVLVRVINNITLILGNINRHSVFPPLR